MKLKKRVAKRVNYTFFTRKIAMKRERKTPGFSLSLLPWHMVISKSGVVMKKTAQGVSGMRGRGAQYFRVGHIPSRMDHKTRDLSAKRKAPRCEVYRYIYSLSLFSTLAVNSTTWHIGIGEQRKKGVGWPPPPYLILSLLSFSFSYFFFVDKGLEVSCFGFFFCYTPFRQLLHLLFLRCALVLVLFLFCYRLCKESVYLHFI